jgi:rhodanese-related sulfurtransferase
MREIDVAAFEAALAVGVTAIDVRELSEYAEGHVPGVLAVPMGQLAGFVRTLVDPGPIHLVCWSGRRSAAVGELLESSGREVVNVAGGTAAWIRSGRPVARGL